MLKGHRERRINKMEGLSEFQRSWDEAVHPLNEVEVVLRQTQFGNISSTGIPGDYRGYALSRWHPQFRDSLEAGVRDLVLLITTQFKWITYSSCEGHTYGCLGLPAVERRVGILPRSESEKELIVAVLMELVNASKGRFPFSAIYLDLETELVDSGNVRYSAVDLIFRRRRRGTWKAYFDGVKEYYDWVLAHLAVCGKSKNPG